MDIGVFPTGALNTITDVEGVRVGQVTVWEGEDVRTGVTAILPHPGNIFREKVPGAVMVGNGFGKLLGVTQVRELGEIETPILLTCTLCVWKAADFMVEWLLERHGMEGVGSINPAVGETNDGGLSDIRSRPIRPEHVRQALESATSGPVEEGTVGAGTGTQAFGWKGGIGTSSRRLPANLGGWTVGVLVQSNYGGVLTIRGATGNNLRSVTVDIPVGLMTCVTGVSGSGKSTLVNDVLYPALARLYHASSRRPGAHRGLAGTGQLDKVVSIDQRPIVEKGQRISAGSVIADSDRRSRAALWGK